MIELENERLDALNSSLLIYTMTFHSTTPRAGDATLKRQPQHPDCHIQLLLRTVLHHTQRLFQATTCKPPRKACFAMLMESNLFHMEAMPRSYPLKHECAGGTIARCGLL
jgi:hypothetical protein